MSDLHKMLVANFNPTFEEWEDVREATDAEIIAAVREMDGAEEVTVYERVLFIDDIETAIGTPIVRPPGRYLVIPLDMEDDR